MIFHTTKTETDIIIKIAKRAEKFFQGRGVPKTRLAIIMDITATHANGCPLRLEELAAADDNNFCHDIAGIHNNLNRTTGELENCFLPRYAKRL